VNGSLIDIAWPASSMKEKKEKGEKEHHGWRSGEEDGRVIGDFLFLYL